MRRRITVATLLHKCNAILLASPVGVASRGIAVGIAVLVTVVDTSGSEEPGTNKLVYKYQEHFLLSPKNLWLDGGRANRERQRVNKN